MPIITATTASTYPATGPPLAGSILVLPLFGSIGTSTTGGCGEGVPLGVRVRVARGDSVMGGVSETEGVSLCVRAKKGVRVALNVAVMELVALTEGVTLPLAVTLMVAVMVAVMLLVMDCAHAMAATSTARSAALRIILPSLFNFLRSEGSALA